MFDIINEEENDKILQLFEFINDMETDPAIFDTKVGPKNLNDSLDSVEI